MTSRLPFRKNIEPLSQILSDLEKIKINQKDKKTYSANFTKSHSFDGKDDEEKKKNYYKSLVQTKDQQIDKLVEKLTILYNYNNQFAIDNEKLQKEVTILQQNYNEVSQQHCTECELLTKDNNDLKNDIKMMKTLVYRLNVQLENHQELLRKLNPKEKNISKIDFDGQSEDINWGTVNTHTLSPLLNAYQEFLLEKNDLIQQYENEISIFTGNLKEIIEENDNVHAEISNLKRSHDSWMTDKTRLQAQLEICRNKAELQTRRADLAKEKLVEVMRCYEKKVQSQALDIERLQEAYSRSKNELATLRNLQQQPEVIVESLKECQKLFEELKVQHENEKLRLLSEIDDLKKSTFEYEKMSSNLKDEYKDLKLLTERQKELNEVLSNKNSSLRKNLHRVRHSRESLKKRLKTAIEWSRNIEGGQNRLKNTWNDLNKIQNLIEQKEHQIKTMQMRHLAEIETLTRKLQQREETLRNVLKEKVHGKLHYSTSHHHKK